MLTPADPQHYALAEVVFPDEPGSLVLEVDMTLAADPAVATALTTILAQATDSATAQADIRQIAQDLDWRVTLLPRGGTQHIRVAHD
ncbi:MAG TPA: hypothetical protein VFY23_04920 [Candidatus Limnocylindrales bacterium]|nr:hypothetical protein [Candidatus Limnocylindrales bacterium]